MVLDESQHNQLLTVSGFMVKTRRLPELAEAWRALKTDVFKIPPDYELKYTCPAMHPTRKALEAKGWDQKSRVPRMLQTIRELDLLLIADTLVDLRSDVQGKSPRDFYLHALKWCVRRFANEVQSVEKGVHWVVVDMFKDLGTAPFETYREQYWEVERFSMTTAPALVDCGLVPILTASHAKHSEPLQIADVIAGCVREFCAYNITRAVVDDLPEIHYEDRNMALIAPSFRRGRTGRLQGYGFDVFPRDHPARNGLINWTDRLTTEGQKAVGA